MAADDEQGLMSSEDAPGGGKSILKEKIDQLKAYFTSAFSKEGFIVKKQIALKNIIIGLVSYGLEELTSAEVFDCPLKGHKLYGFCFLFFPAFVLFCANILLIGEVWKLTRRCFVPRYQRHGACISGVIPATVKSMAGPAVWLVACFKTGTYYVCATVGPGVNKRNLTDAAEIKALEDQIDVQEGFSHVCAWIVFGIITFLGTFVVILDRCYLKDDILAENLYKFEEREAAAAMLVFREWMNGGKADEMLLCGKDLEIGEGEKLKLIAKGLPERKAIQVVEKMFEESKNTGSCEYKGICKTFRAKYPRVLTGDPTKPWCLETMAGTGQETDAPVAP